MLDLVALLPWWVALGLAVVSYVLLHWMALTARPMAVQPGQLGAALNSMVLKAFVQAGQYVLPLLFGAGAALSFFRRRQREQLLGLVKGGGNSAADLVSAMSWQEFEMLVGETFRQQGFKVLEVGGGGADGGVDLVLMRGGEKQLVQCKQWKAYKVGVSIVRELYGVMAAQGATGGYVVTSGKFTKEAESFAHGRNVKLVDGAQLMRLIGSVAKQDGTSSRATAIGVKPPAEEALVKCLLCESPMIKRVARQGQNRGQAFWGCTTYPKCRGTRPA